MAPAAGWQFTIGLEAVQVICALAAGAAPPKAKATAAASELYRRGFPARPLLLALPLLFSNSPTATQAPSDSFQMERYVLFMRFFSDFRLSSQRAPRFDGHAIREKLQQNRLVDSAVFVLLTLLSNSRTASLKVRSF
nr:hypothetical protein [Variovorax boronicumulans]